MDQIMVLHTGGMVVDHQTIIHHFPFDIAFIQVIVQHSICPIPELFNLIISSKVMMGTAIPPGSYKKHSQEYLSFPKSEVHRLKSTFLLIRFLRKPDIGIMGQS